MINKIHLKKLFFLCTFFLIFNICKVYSSGQVVIIAKIENEIITNIDIEKENRYLLALNPSLRSIEQNKLLKIAKRSIEKEIIKKIEVSKYYKIEDDNTYFNEIFKDFYKGLNLKTEDELKKYLLNYNLDLKEVKNKIKIEALWNEMIYTKFKNQIDIDELKLRDKLKKKISTKKDNYSYLLYEIIFSSKKKEEIDKKYKIIKNSINEIGFKKTANLYSETDSSKRNGKSGWVDENQLSKIIQKQLSSIKKGEFTKIISVTGGSLILKIEDKKKIENNLNFEDELKKTISFERIRQLNQFSTIYFSKIKNNLSIYEK